MINAQLPLAIPSCLCFEASFNSFISDIKEYGLSSLIILVDFDITCTSYENHIRQIKFLKKRISSLSNLRNLKVKYISNILLRSEIYSAKDFSVIKDKRNFNMCMVTLPLFNSPEISMQNIFTVKNNGLSPVLNFFDKYLITYPKSFCNSIASTENISFVYDTSSLSNPTVSRSVQQALSANNFVIFSASHLTASLIDKEINIFFDSLSQKHKMLLGYSSNQLFKKLFN